MSFNIEIVSPVKMVYSGEVNSVSIPGTSGSFQVLQNHSPLISTFSVGKIKIEKDSEIIEFSTSGGVFEVKSNKAIVLAESIESKDEINIERARQSKLRAEEILKMIEITEDEKDDAKLALQRAVNRIKFKEKS